MSDDALEDEVGRAMKLDDQQLDPRIERMIEGRLSPSEFEALEGDAASNPELAEALALARPLSASTDQNIAERASQAIQSAPPATTNQARSRPFALAFVAAVAAAAAVAFVMLRPDGVESIPLYQLTARTNDAAWRSDVADRRESLRADSELSIVLSPEQPVVEKTVAVLYVVTSSTVRASSVAAERSPDGAARWVASGRAMTGVERGSVELIAVVGRPGALPDADRARRESRGPGWQAAVLRVQIEPVGGGQ